MRLFMSRLHGFPEGCRRGGQDANENVGQEGEAPAEPLVGGFKAAQQELRPPGVGFVFVRFSLFVSSMLCLCLFVCLLVCVCLLLTFVMGIQ